MNLPHRLPLWITTTVVLLGCAVAAAIWVLRHDATPQTRAADCAVVGELAREWRATAAADDAAASSDQHGGPRRGGDWSAMNEKAKAAAESVSTPSLKKDLNQWASGFALFAELKQATSAGPAQPGPEHLSTADESAVLIYGTADDLRAHCPNDWLPGGGS